MQPSYNYGHPMPQDFVYQVKFNVIATGKINAMSKRRISWQYGFPNQEAISAGQSGSDCRSEEHDVSLVWSVSSGKRMIMSNGKQLYVGVNKASVFEHQWIDVRGNTIKLIAHAAPPMSNASSSRQYDLIMNGKSFFDLPKSHEIGLKGPVDSTTSIILSSEETPLEAQPPTSEKNFLLKAHKYNTTTLVSYNYHTIKEKVGDLGKGLGKKVIIGTLLFAAIWTVTKLPFYVSFNNDGDAAYNSHGIELSINLGHWLKGYRGRQMRAPACNFCLIHATLGITLLVMMVLTLIKKSWRRKYCIPFFVFSIVFGIHTIPASLINDSNFLKILFMFACLLVIGMGVWGLYTNKHYDKDPIQAEKNFFTQYFWITLACMGAAILETPQIIKSFEDHKSTGEWKIYGDGGPHPKFGHTLYDVLPERVGMTMFWVFCGIVWFIWPLYLLDLGKESPGDKEVLSDDDVEERTPFGTVNEGYS